ncbi:TPA: MerR family transcriptional regulator [Legionella pneumophila]|nr:MerR family transcriptional regulator [Legionella pneumophila]
MLFMDKPNFNGFSRIMYDDLFLSDLGKYIEAKKSGDDVSRCLTEKKFTIKDIDSTYRVINHWSKLGLFDDSRPDSKGWRKFSLVDITWLRVLVELRSFGLSLEKLKIAYEEIKQNPIMFEFGIASCMLKKGINLIVFKDGYIQISPRNAIEISQSISYFKETAYLVVSLNRCLELVLPNRNYSPKLNTVELSNKELQVLRELRLGSYEQVAIIMKEGDIEYINTSTKHFEIGILADILNKVSRGDFHIKKVRDKILYIKEIKKIKADESTL